MSILITAIARKDFLSLFYERHSEFRERLALPEVFIVKNFYPKGEILGMRHEVREKNHATSPSWHPLYDDCPDYHRIHDDYEKAYVKGKIHVYYHHGFYPQNNALFDYFHEVFALKDFMAEGMTRGALHHRPSQGIIARVNFHHYPSGGGYQAEHVDPSGEHARIQTLVAGSEFGSDFKSGGVYAKKAINEEARFIDTFTKPGDLLVLSPAIPHGVAPIDPEDKLDWNKMNGRWMILPIYVWSDYPNPKNIKPEQVK